MPPSEVDIIDAGYYFKRLTCNRLNDICKLYQATYNKILPIDFFARKYNTAYTKVMYTGFLAYDKTHHPVAYYGVIPCYIQYNFEPVLAAQSADTMTHPGHRHKGLFILLANLTFKLCHDEGIKLLFGFPNQNSLPGFINTLQWQLKGHLACFTYPVNSIPLEKLAIKFGLSGLYYTYAKRQLKNYLVSGSGIKSSIFAENFGGVYRGPDYLQYKTYNQTYTVKVARFMVWFKIKNGFIIGDRNRQLGRIYLTFKVF